MKKVFLLAALALLVLNIPVVRVLSISNHKNLSERVYSRSAFTQGFAINYTHSVNKGRVHDFYRCVQNGSLELYKTQFVSYGAGIPEPGETRGASFRVSDDGYVIEDLHRVLPELMMAVGVVAEHSVTVYANEFFLKDFFKPQTSLIFQIRRVSLLRYFLTKKI